MDERDAGEKKRIVLRHQVRKGMGRKARQTDGASRQSFHRHRACCYWGPCKKRRKLKKKKKREGKISCKIMPPCHKYKLREGVHLQLAWHHSVISVSASIEGNEKKKETSACNVVPPCPNRMSELYTTSDTAPISRTAGGFEVGVPLKRNHSRICCCSRRVKFFIGIPWSSPSGARKLTPAPVGTVRFNRRAMALPAMSRYMRPHFSIRA